MPDPQPRNPNRAVRTYYAVLLWLAETCDRSEFQWFNSFVQKFYRHLLIPLIAIRLNATLKAQEKIQLSIRHSAATRHRFNTFFSDVDLTAIAPHSSEETYQRIRSHLLKWKRWIPSLGELEIYSQEEWNNLQKWLEEFGSTYSFLRDLRKTGWMAREKREHLIPYHQKKAERSHDILVQKHSPQGTWIHPLKKFLAHYTCLLPLSAQPIQWPIYSRYLGYRMNPSSAGALTADELHLSTEETLILLTLCPVIQDYPKQLQDLAQELRKTPEFRANAHALSAIEWTMARGFNRGSPRELPWMPQWLVDLESSFLDTRAL